MKTKRLFAILLAALMLLSLLPAGALAEEAAVKVSFACSPAETAVTLRPKGSGDAVTPEADGTYLLQPGDYVWSASAEGFLPAEGAFTVKAGEPQTVQVTLSPIPAPEPQPAPQLGRLVKSINK